MTEFTPAEKSAIRNKLEQIVKAIVQDKDTLVLNIGDRLESFYMDDLADWVEDVATVPQLNAINEQFGNVSTFVSEKLAGTIEQTLPDIESHIDLIVARLINRLDLFSSDYKVSLADECHNNTDELVDDVVDENDVGNVVVQLIKENQIKTKADPKNNSLDNFIEI